MEVYAAAQAEAAEQRRQRAPLDACPTCLFPPGTPGYVRQDLPADHPGFGKLMPCPDCHDGRLAERLRERSQLTGWLRQATLDNYHLLKGEGNREALGAARNFAGSPVAWLTLHGPYGPGKTHLLAGIVNHCADNRVAALYFTWPDLLADLIACFEADSDISHTALFQRVRSVRVLALDEVDRNKFNPTSFALQTLFRLMDARYRELDDLGTVIATNAIPSPDDKTLGYLWSRAHDHRCRTVEVGGGDARGVNFACGKE